MEMESWRDMLEESFKESGDDFGKMVTTLTPDELNRKFDSGYGGSNGSPFTAWGDKFVYFPVVYDGAEWVGYAPRNPCDKATEHSGGGQ